MTAAETAAQDIVEKESNWFPEAFEKDPQLSTSRASSILEISSATIRRNLRRDLKGKRYIQYSRF